MRARLIPDDASEARAAAFLPMSRAMGSDAFAAYEAEVRAARRSAYHMITPVGLEDVLLATGALLIMSTSLELLTRVTPCKRANMGYRDDGVVVTHPTRSAGKALTPRTDLETAALLAEVRATNDSVRAIPMLAIQPVNRRRSILFPLSSPRICKPIFEQIAESLEVQLIRSPHRRVMMFVLERIDEQGFHAFFTA